MYSKINTKDSLWLLMNATRLRSARWARWASSPRPCRLVINLAEGLTVDMRLRLATADEARIRDDGEGFRLATRRSSDFDKLDVTRDGARNAKIAIA